VRPALTIFDMALTAIALVGLLSLRFRSKFIKFRPERGEKKPINWRGALWQVALLGIGAGITYIVTRLKSGSK
jgi:hypothetical protein